MSNAIIAALVAGIGLTEPQAATLAADNADAIADLPALRFVQAVGYVDAAGPSHVILLDGDTALCDLRVRADLRGL